MIVNRPSYLGLSEQVFKHKIDRAKMILAKCTLCPRQCHVNRLAGEIGFCGAGAELEVAHWQKHFGEEPPLADNGGAGAIFFAHCNLKCVYCQNYQISQRLGIKKTITSAKLCAIFLTLQEQGAQNIDLISATHFVPQLIEAIYLARESGLRLPILYNTNAYESSSTLESLSGIIDIYLPDIKYNDEQNALRYSWVSDYMSFSRKAIALMYAQVGDLVIDKNGCAKKGLLVRHLILPNRIAGSLSLFDYLKKTAGLNIGLSLLGQYRPCFRAKEFEELNRGITYDEYKEVVDCVERLGFEQCWIQELDSSSVYLPDFERKEVFQ